MTWLNFCFGKFWYVGTHIHLSLVCWLRSSIVDLDLYFTVGWLLSFGQFPNNYLCYFSDTGTEFKLSMNQHADAHIWSWPTFHSQVTFVSFQIEVSFRKASSDAIILPYLFVKVFHVWPWPVFLCLLILLGWFWSIASVIGFKSVSKQLSAKISMIHDAYLHGSMTSWLQSAISELELYFMVQ